MKAKLVEKPREKATSCDLIINTAYMQVLSLELMLRDVESRLAKESAQIQREKKLKYTRFIDFTKKALHYAEQLTEDIFEVDSQNKWKNIPVWQEESNELARLILLFADRSKDIDNVNKVFKLLRELPGEDIITEEDLDYYRLRK